MTADKMPIISMIAAISAQTRALGKNNALLWHLPEDLQYFRDVTRGHPVIMGARTHASIGRALPARTNIVLSFDPSYLAPGCTVVTTLDAAFELARKENTEIFVIGGGLVYASALPFADRLYLTLVDDEGADADVFFPPYETAFTKVVSEKPGESGGVKLKWVVLERG